MLWPELIRRWLAGTDRELVATYPRRADLPRHFWGDMMASARQRMYFGGYTSYFLWLNAPQAHTHLDLESHPLKLATRINMTRMEVARSGAADLMPVRLSDRHIATSVWIFDDEAVLATHIGAGLGHDSLTQHFRQRKKEGPFSRLLEHFEWLWADARPAETETPS